MQRRHCCQVTAKNTRRLLDVNNIFADANAVNVLLIVELDTTSKRDTIHRICHALIRSNYALHFIIGWSGLLAATVVFILIGNNQIKRFHLNNTPTIGKNMYLVYRLKNLRIALAQTKKRNRRVPMFCYIKPLMATRFYICWIVVLFWKWYI